MKSFSPPQFPHILLFYLAACGSATNHDLQDEQPLPFAGYESEQYQNQQAWLCHPDAEDNICRSSLDITVVQADGSTQSEIFQAAQSPAVDCFYLYPTVSLDSTSNSDMNAGEEEIFVTQNQAARLRQLCRLFVPIYRQVTVAALFSEEAPGDFDVAYGDALDQVASNGPGVQTEICSSTCP